MINLVLKNIKEVPTEIERDELKKLSEELLDYLDQRFKKYPKNLELEVIVNKSGKISSISASINLMSKKILLAEEDKYVVLAARRLFPKFKSAVLKQHELERQV